MRGRRVVARQGSAWMRPPRAWSIGGAVCKAKRKCSRGVIRSPCGRDAAPCGVRRRAHSAPIDDPSERTSRKCARCAASGTSVAILIYAVAPPHFAISSAMKLLFLTASAAGNVTWQKRVEMVPGGGSTSSAIDRRTCSTSGARVLGCS